jgi:hypothetical protein
MKIVNIDGCIKRSWRHTLVQGTEDFLRTEQDHIFFEDEIMPTCPFSMISEITLYVYRCIERVVMLSWS